MTLSADAAPYQPHNHHHAVSDHGTAIAKPQPATAPPSPTQPASQPQRPRFVVQDSRLAAGVDAGKRRAQLEAKARSDEWLRSQQEAIAHHRATRLREFTDANETAVVTATPIDIRLRCLLAEARRYERARVAERHADEPRDLRRQRERHIDAAYTNLLEDVKRRCGVIAAHNPEAVHQHNLGNEAIGCFSSMLPWSEGVVTVDIEPSSASSVGTEPPAGTPAGSPVAELPPAATSVAAQPPRRLPHGLRPRTTPNHAAKRRSPAASPTAVTTTTTAERAASAPPAASYKWTVPQRLAVDNRKLAACTAARRKRLAAMAPPQPRSPTPVSCSPPTAMPC